MIYLNIMGYWKINSIDIKRDKTAIFGGLDLLGRGLAQLDQPMQAILRARGCHPVMKQV